MMAQDKSPSRARDGVPIIDIRTGQFTDYGAMVFEELWRQVVAGFVTVPCIITNAGNFYTLKARLHKEGAASYGDHMIFAGVPTAGSTGAVTACVSDAEGNALATVKVYKTNGAAQAGNTDIVANSFYLWCYVAALDGGAGGLVLK
jgi:hypothetical protein